MEQRKKRTDEPSELVDFDVSLEQQAETGKNTRKRGRTAVKNSVKAELTPPIPEDGEYTETADDDDEPEIDDSVIIEGEALAADLEEEPEEFTSEDRQEAKRLSHEQADVIAGADSVKAYLKKIGKVALLDAEQEVEKAKAIEAGLYAQHLLDEAERNNERIHPARRRKLSQVAREGERAKNHMLEANLRLVVSIAKRYTGRGMAFLDLIQEGNLGLIRAVQKFDYAKGYKFSTYATWWIRQAVTRGLADQARTIRVPVHMVEVINKMGRIQRELLQDLGRPATDEELAMEMGVEIDKLREIKGYAKEPISLNMEVGNEDGRAELGEFIEDADAPEVFDEISTGLLNTQIERVLATLPEREANVIRLRFGLADGRPRTLDEIGGVYHVSRERVRQIERDTMIKLREPSRSDALQNYLTVEDDR